MKNLILKLGIIFTLGTTSLLPTLWGTFIFDDGEAILKNSLVTQPHKETISKIFTHDFWGVDITHPQSHKSYRPFTTLTYRWDYAIWGKNPFPFHLENLIIHGLNCCLVFWFLKKCLRIAVQDTDFNYKSSERIAFWASIVFAVHPVHVEPLGGLVGRADLLASLTFLAGFVIVPDDSPWSPGLISFFAILGSLFKENAIVLSILQIALDFGIKCRFRVSKTKLVQYFISVFLTASFVIWRLWFQGGPPVFKQFDNPAAFANSTFSRSSSVTYIWALNAFTLFNPIWLCFDWSMGCVKVIETVTDIRLMLTILLGAFFVLVLISAFRRRVIMTACLIASITFFPSSNLVFIVGFVLAERNLYLPSVGYCLLIAYSFLEKKQLKFLIYIVLIFYTRSVQRSMHWIDEMSLFKTGLEVCPNNAKVHYNLGTVLAELGDVISAENSYKAALSLRPDYYQAMNNLGNLIKTRDLVEAEYWLRKAISLKSNFAAAYMNLGIVLSKKNQTEALDCYQNALKYRKIYPDCEYNLGNLYLDIGDSESALNSWKRATLIRPTHTHAWINSVILLEQQGKLEEAKNIGLEAVDILKDCDTLHFILGNVFGKLSKFEMAQYHFEMAIRICQETKKSPPAKYFSNLGVLYHRWGRKDSASEAYRLALKIDPTLESAKKNIELLKL